MTTELTFTNYDILILMEGVGSLIRVPVAPATALKLLRLARIVKPMHDDLVTVQNQIMEKAKEAKLSPVIAQADMKAFHEMPIEMSEIITFKASEFTNNPTLTAISLIQLGELLEIDTDALPKPTPPAQQGPM